MDALLAFSRGSSALAGGLAGLPVDALNAVNQFSPANLTPASWGLRPPVVSQPQAVRDFQDFLRRDSQRETQTMMSEKGKRQMAEFEDVHGFLDAGSYLAANPSLLGTTAVEQVPQLALAIPGRLRATIALQSALAGSMNESETAGELAQPVADGTMTQAEADRRAAEVFTGTALLNAATAGLPGAQTLERLASGQLARVPAARAAGHVATAFAGEAAQEGATEAGEQILQNIATNKPWNQDAGKMAALGALLGGTLGGAGGGLEAIGARGLHDRTAPPHASGPAPADVLKAAIDAMREPHATPQVAGANAETAPRQTTENTAETQKPAVVEHPRGTHGGNGEADIDALLMDNYGQREPATDDAPAAQPATGAFGPIHDQFRHDARAAIAHLAQQQTGEATAALHHHQVGDIDLIWGKEGSAAKEYKDGYGLAKIAKKHPEVLDDLQGFINGLEKNAAQSGKNRIQLESETGKAAVRLEWDGKQKKWLMTAFVKDASPAATNGRTGVAGRAESAPPAEQVAGLGQDSNANGAQPAATAKPEVLEDFGEKLGGARKDMAQSLKKDLSDAEIAAQPLSKIWPKEEISRIEDTQIAAMLTVARELIPPKPRKAYSFGNWAKKVKEARKIAQDMLGGKLPAQKFIQEMSVHPVLSGLADKAELLAAIDRTHWSRVGNVQRSTKETGQFFFVEIDGRRHTFRDATTVEAAADRAHELLQTERESSKLQFEVRGSPRQQKFFINKNGDPDLTSLQHFTSAEDAFAFLKSEDGYNQLVTAWQAHKSRANVKKDDTRNKENRPRSGADWRNGKDVTPEQFTDAFGFRGVEFGNWVGNKNRQRQDSMNEAHDALRDLADILNIPARAISLNGKLGLAFGARGHGKASAHYEPGNVVINLTKTRGAGVLAHEWFHALDNYFSRMRRDGQEYPFSGDNDVYRKRNYITYRPEAFYEKNGAMIAVKDFEQAVAKGKPEPGRFGFRNDQERHIARTWHQIGENTDGWTRRDAVRPEVEQAFAQVVQTLDQSPMRKRAGSIDRGKEDGYWSRIIERAARSFENYVIAEMQGKGYHNDYLANVTPVENFKRDPGKYPYLLPDEIAPVKQAFDKLFSILQTKTDDKGNVALFLRSQQDKPTRPDFTRTKQDLTQARIRAVIEAARQPGHAPQKAVLGKVSDWLAGEAAKHGIDVKGYTHTLDGSAVRHIVKNHYGKNAETSRGQIALTDADLQALPELLESPDRVVFGTKNRLGNAQVAYVKRMPDGSTLYLEEIRTGREELAAVSARKYPATMNVERIVSTLHPNVRNDGINVIVSAPPDTAQAPSIRRVQSAVDTLKQALPGAPDIVVVESMTDSRIPAAVRAEDARQRTGGASGEPDGFFYRGTVYLVAGQLTTDADVARALFHEVLGHHGLRGAFGESLHPLLDALADARTADIAAKRAQYGLPDTIEGRRMAAEEVLAGMAENTPDLGWVKRAIAAIRAWLRNAGLNLTLSDSELVRDFILPAREFVLRGERAESRFAMPVFNRGSNTTTARQKLLEMQAVSVAGLNPDLTGKQLRDAANAAYRAAAAKGAVRMADGRNVRLTDVGLKKTRSHSADRRVLDMMASLREVLGKAVPIRSIQHKPEYPTDSIRAWHYYGSKITLRGQELYAKLVVRESVNGEIYYDSDLSGIENVGGRDGDAIPAKPEAASLAADNRSLWQLLDDGKHNQDSTPAFSRREDSRAWEGFTEEQRAFLTKAGLAPDARGFWDRARDGLRKTLSLDGAISWHDRVMQGAVDRKTRRRGTSAWNTRGQRGSRHRRAADGGLRPARTRRAR